MMRKGICQKIENEIHRGKLWLSKVGEESDKGVGNTFDFGYGESNFVML